jgi:bifunctional DNA-binding transcriptional regulator/antitoxin component of YhaV-PrlF toxin-antitoxin module
MAISDKTKSEGLRISAIGMIELPSNVRQALGFREGESKILEIQIEKGAVRITAAEKVGANTHEASPLGLLKLPKEAHHVLSEGKEGSYILTPQSELQGKGSDQIIYLRSV